MTFKSTDVNASGSVAFISVVLGDFPFFFCSQIHRSGLQHRRRKEGRKLAFSGLRSVVLVIFVFLSFELFFFFVHSTTAFMPYCCCDCTHHEVV